MKPDKLKNALNKLLNSPILSRQFPIIDNVEVTDVKLRHDNQSYVVYIHMDLNEKPPMLLRDFENKLWFLLHDIMDTLGLRGHNFYMFDIIYPPYDKVKLMDEI